MTMSERYLVERSAKRDENGISSLMIFFLFFSLHPFRASIDSKPYNNNSINNMIILDGNDGCET